MAAVYGVIDRYQVLAQFTAILAMALDSCGTVEESVSLVAVGDVMLSRGVGSTIARQGLDYPLNRVRTLLAQADITFGNLESPISSVGSPLPGKGIWFRAKPETVGMLVDSGFDIMSIANNHALDYDAPAFLETIQLLRSQGIEPVGGGQNIQEALTPVIADVNGVKIGFLAFSDMADIFWSRAYPRRLKATEEIAGIAPLDKQLIIESVSDLKDRVDVVVVSLHWGNEYTDEPLEAQRKLAYSLIDHGVDLIIGHHPHTLQGIEVYKHGVIAYSLGNFLFDQRPEKTRQGLILAAEITKLGVKKARLLPVLIEAAQPQVVTGVEGEEILGRVMRLSGRLGTLLLPNSTEALVTVAGSDIAR